MEGISNSVTWRFCPPWKISETTMEDIRNNDGRYQRQG